MDTDKDLALPKNCYDLSALSPSGEHLKNSIFVNLVHNENGH
jgi:hypothetical protein